MGKSEIEAKNISLSGKNEYQDVERELYIAPMDIYDSNDESVDDGTIKQTGESLFEISLSKNEVVETKENKDSKHPVLDKIHGFLDIAGFIPAFGAVPDIANGIIYLCQGDFANMGLSFVAAVPVYGDTVAGVAKGAKYVGKGIKATKKSKVVAANVKRIESFDIDKQTEYIVKMAKKNDIKKVSLLWTNGTKFNAKAVVRKAKEINPKLEIQAFETSIEGIQMEKKVNRKLVEEGLRRGYSKERVFKLLKENRLWESFAERGNSKLKSELQAFQRAESEKYANKIRKDHIIEFKRSGLDYGQANKAELELLGREEKYVDEEWNIVKEGDVLTRYRDPSTGSTRIISNEQLKRLKHKKFSK